MSRRRKSERDTSVISSGPLERRVSYLEDIVSPLPRLSFLPVVRAPLTEIADDRLWSPDSNPRAPSSRRWNSQIVFPPPAAAKKASDRRVTGLSPMSVVQMQFKAPEFVVHCVRRKQRKEVLHALRKTGKGSGRPRRFTPFSNVRC